MDSNSLKIALVGNPNSGKTTMFNELTGSVQHVGNWPGVTVERKEGYLKTDSRIKVVDLPGIYSLSPYTPEEVVTRNFLLDERPDLIVNIVDATNITRNLYLTTQLLELGIPVIVILNMMDVVEKKGDIIDVPVLSQELGCLVVEASALKGRGIFEAIEKGMEMALDKVVPNCNLAFSLDIETSLVKIGQLIENRFPNVPSLEELRWYSLKLFEHDSHVSKGWLNSQDLLTEINSIIKPCEQKLGDDGESLIIDGRYTWITQLIQKCYTPSQSKHIFSSNNIDKIITNRFLALPIFAGVMFLVYYISVTWLGSMFADWTNKVLFGEIIIGNLANWLEQLSVASWLQSLLLDGVLSGVGAVLGFVPQIMLLFLMISLLEDCGYMSRVAFIMDRLFRRFGLSGKSIIPMLIGSGCSVPGIMASRTVENISERRMTIILTPFIPCSAKLPVIALLAGAFFPENPWVAPSMYFLGISMAMLSGIILKQTKYFKGEISPFVMELPPYHLPSMRSVTLQVWQRVKGFIIKAGTVIFLASAVIWFLNSFDFALNMVEADQSILSDIGRLIAPIFAPLGFGLWQPAVAIITGLLAKETIVSTFAVLLGVPEIGNSLASMMSSFFTPASAIAFLSFVLLAAPCFAAIGTMYRELESGKWTLFAISYQTGLAYVVSFIVYNVARLIM